MLSILLQPLSTTTFFVYQHLQNVEHVGHAGSAFPSIRTPNTSHQAMPNKPDLSGQNRGEATPKTGGYSPSSASRLMMN